MKNINKKIGFVLALIGVYLVFFVIGSLLGGRFGGIENPPKISWAGGGQVNILFMGTDARGKEDNARSDTMILASIDKGENKAALVWIPRDTRIEISKGRHDKINSVNVLKGPEAACQVVGKLLNTRVDYYILTNFQGFAAMIDELGGVHIDVETNMQHYDPDPALNINLAKGPQVLNGKDALSYVRYRSGPTADIGRTARQQKFAKALIAEMFTSKNIFKLPELVPALTSQVKTNLPAKEISTLAGLAHKFSTGNVVTQTLPGYSFTEASSGASYWQADEKVAQRLLAALFDGETFKVIQDPPDWVAKLPAAEPAEGEAPVLNTPEAQEELEQAEQPEQPEQAEQPEIDQPVDNEEGSSEVDDKVKTDEEPDGTGDGEDGDGSIDPEEKHTDSPEPEAGPDEAQPVQDPDDPVQPDNDETGIPAVSESFGSD